MVITTNDGRALLGLIYLRRDPQDRNRSHYSLLAIRKSGSLRVLRVRVLHCSMRFILQVVLLLVIHPSLRPISVSLFHLQSISTILATHRSIKPSRPSPNTWSR